MVTVAALVAAPGLGQVVLNALVVLNVGAAFNAGIAAGKALDRVLRAEQFWVPNWYKDAYWLAYWDKFGRPEIAPKYDRGIVDTWWYDEAKAKRIANGN